MKIKNDQKGYTLIELIVSMVIIAVALVGTLTAFNTVTQRSARPIVMSHSLGIAKSYLTEILLKDFPSTLPCPSPPASGRRFYDNICDYDGLVDIGAKDQDGNQITGLEKYEVRVNIDTTGASLDGLISGTDVVRIDVKVKLENETSEVFISGYKANF